MTMNTTLSHPFTEYANAIRTWSRDCVRPYARIADENHAPPENWPEILDQCPVALKRKDRRDAAPPRFDDGSWARELVVTEAINYGDIWVNDVLGQGIGHLTVKLMGTPAQIEQWYRPIVRDGGVAAFALTESHFGSDTSMVATTATRDGDTWVINGSKMYCSGGASADYTVVFASTDKSAGPAAIAAFIVPKATPGFIVAKPNESKLGIRSWQTSELVFEGCTIPLDNRLGWSAEGAVTKFRSPRGPRRRASQRADGDRPTPTEDASEPTLPLIGSSTPTGSDQPGPGASPGAPGAAAPGASAAQTPGMVALLDAASPLLFRAFAQPRDRGLHGLGALLPGSAAAS